MQFNFTDEKLAKIEEAKLHYHDYIYEKPLKAGKGVEVDIGGATA